MNTNTQYRYFYTDPLAAAWMAKHFGMRFGFYDERSDFREYEVPITGEDDFWRADRGRFYIHHHSLPLLEPRPGDFGMDCVGNPSEGVIPCRYVHSRGVPQWIAYTQHNWGQPTGEVKIIQRDGKPFHFPEREAV